MEARGFKPGGTMMIFSVSLVGFQPPKPDEQGGSSPLKAERNLMKFDLPGHAKPHENSQTSQRINCS